MVCPYFQAFLVCGVMFFPFTKWLSVSWKAGILLSHYLNPNRGPYSLMVTNIISKMPPATARVGAGTEMCSCKRSFL